MSHLPCSRLPGALLLLVLPCAGLAHAGPTADVAVLTFRLPADARLEVGGAPTAATGTERSFVTPPLAAGRRCSYRGVATWQEGSKSRRVERVVRFRAGDDLVVDLTVPEKRKGRGKPRTKDDPKADDLKGAERLKAPRQESEKESRAPRSRTFEFTYAGAVTGLKRGQEARVWLPVPRSDGEQRIDLLARDLPRGAQGATEAVEPTYGNRILSFTAKADARGEIPYRLVCKVTRREVRGEAVGVPDEDARRVARFLQPDALVPITGKPLKLLEGKVLPAEVMGQARLMYDVVDANMTYRKDAPGWGRGDSAWACDSRFGNCSDFHSLFISLARAKKIPAKFEIGFALPPTRGGGEVAGYHCWAFFRPPGKGWVPVDVSEANRHPEWKDYCFGNLTADRVAFSTGRDVTLVPKQVGGPLNFFIYPYAEVGGKEVPQERIVKRFTFRDVSGE